jgi:FAD/FMN-containing dehydrogenase
LSLALDAVQTGMMKSIRDVFDPNHVLNRTKILP